MTVLLYGLSLITDLHGTSVYLFVCACISLSDTSTATDIRWGEKTDLYQCLGLRNRLRILCVGKMDQRL